MRDPGALVVLGKALFWDMQLGSDGRTACATCSLSRRRQSSRPESAVDPLGDFPANYILSPGDFLFHQLADINNSGSTILRDSSMRAGSAGVFRRMFTGVAAGSAIDTGFDVNDTPAFSVAGSTCARSHAEFAFRHQRRFQFS